MNDFERKVIDVKNKPKSFFLYELGKKSESEPREFIVREDKGHGSSAFVYEAEYVSGNVSHKCILKELYPSECGLIRDELMACHFVLQIMIMRKNY